MFDKATFSTKARHSGIRRIVLKHSLAAAILGLSFRGRANAGIVVLPAVRILLLLRSHLNCPISSLVTTAPEGAFGECSGSPSHPSDDRFFFSSFLFGTDSASPTST